MLKTRRLNPTGISVKRETPLIVFGACILIVIVILMSFFPMTWNVKDEAYIKDLEKRVSDLERKLTESPQLPAKLPNDETNRIQTDRLLSDSRKLEESMAIQSKMMAGRVDELQNQVAEMRREMAREKQKKAVVTPESKRTQAVAAKPVKEKLIKEKRTHLVRQGDTFYSISKSYDLSLKKLRELNKFDDKARLYPGQTIIVGP